MADDIFETGRDSWWKPSLRETPIPGSYEIRDFAQELETKKIAKSYGFKSSGRKRNADPSRTGFRLMPGLYATKSFVQENNDKKQTYNFKSTNRENKSAVVIGVQDKQLLKSDISPIKYAQEFETVSKSHSAHSMFKSQSSRFPTIYFQPKAGPSPSQYEVRKHDKRTTKGPTSSFKSSTPRFKQAHVLKTPGPGTYSKMLQYPMPKHIHEVGRYHGVFFPPGMDENICDGCNFSKAARCCFTKNTFYHGCEFDNLSYEHQI